MSLAKRPAHFDARATVPSLTPSPASHGRRRRTSAAGEAASRAKVVAKKRKLRQSTSQSSETTASPTISSGESGRSSAASPAYSGNLRGIAITCSGLYFILLGTRRLEIASPLFSFPLFFCVFR